MVNNDRIVPVTNTDLLTLYALVLALNLQAQDETLAVLQPLQNQAVLQNLNQVSQPKKLMMIVSMMRRRKRLKICVMDKRTKR